jgi:hypothetical protein
MVLVTNRRLRSPGVNKRPTIDIDHAKVRGGCAASSALRSGACPVNSGEFNYCWRP